MEKKVVRNIRFMTNEYTDSQEILEKARRTINKNELNFKVVDDDSADIVVPIGGDGAFLKAFRKTNFNSDLVYVGINTGTIGFLQSADENMLEKYKKYLIEEEKSKNTVDCFLFWTSHLNLKIIVKFTKLLMRLR